jgi:hypothetical protein
MLHRIKIQPISNVTLKTRNQEGVTNPVYAFKSAATNTRTHCFAKNLGFVVHAYYFPTVTLRIDLPFYSLHS